MIDLEKEQFILSGLFPTVFGAFPPFKLPAAQLSEHLWTDLKDYLSKIQEESYLMKESKSDFQEMLDKFEDKSLFYYHFFHSCGFVLVVEKRDE